MKIFKLTTTVICLAILATSCSHNENKFQLAYSGTVTFNNDSTIITSVSKNGFVTYTHGDNKIVIEPNNKGGVVYSINGDDKQEHLNNDQKVLLKEATDSVVKSERDKVNDKQ